MHRIHHTKPSITELKSQHALDAEANALGGKQYEYIPLLAELLQHNLGIPYSIITSKSILGEREG